MNLKNFRRLEKKLGHPPTQVEVRHHFYQNLLQFQHKDQWIHASHFVTNLN
jgi:hypothetical protein